MRGLGPGSFGVSGLGAGGSISATPNLSLISLIDNVRPLRILNSAFRPPNRDLRLLVGLHALESFLFSAVLFFRPQADYRGGELPNTKHKW